MSKRKPRSASAFRRRGALREPYDVVLIVCEGKKTEPEYFRGLRKTYRLNSANIKIVPGDRGNDPVSVVKFAIEEYRQANGDFDRVYCVFDRNGHANYDEALALIAASPIGKENKLQAITSVPCFELWILLHFVFSTAPFTAAGGRSACDNVIRVVRAHMPEYDKALTDVFSCLQPRLDTALAHGDRLTRHNRDAHSVDPATRVHELVKYLRELRTIGTVRKVIPADG